MIPGQSADVCTVLSIFPLALRETKPGLFPHSFNLRACDDPQEKVTTLIVHRAKFSVYIDESRPALIVPEPADIVAESICHDYKVSVIFYEPNISEPGLIWVHGGYSDSEALADAAIRVKLSDAREKQNTWFSRLVSAADDDWGRFHARKMISDLQRLAARNLNLDREWDIEQEIAKEHRPIPCKFCRADVHPDSIICMHCRGILNMERFRSEYVSADAALTPPPPAQAPSGRVAHG